MKMKHILFILFFTFFIVGVSFSQEGNPKASLDKDQPSISLSDTNRLFVQNAKQGDLLQIYSIVGVKVLEVKMNATSRELILNTLPKGYYIVKVSDFVRKIAIK